MNAIAFDAGGEEFTDRTRRGIGGIRSTHDFAEPDDDVVAFENHHQRASGAHEAREALEKAAFAVHGIKTFGFALRQPDQARGNDLELVRLEHLDDVAYVRVGHGVRLDDREGALYRHDFLVRFG